MAIASRNLYRRTFLTGAASITLSLLTASSTQAATGIEALDTEALMMKTPTSALLVAIALTPGNRLVASGEHGVIIYSDDDGTSWTQASVPVNVTLTCVAFATADIGWAAGHFGVILNTQDGGKSWQEQLNGIQANQLTMRAAQAPSIAANPSPGAPLALRRAQHFMQAGPDNPFLTMLVFSPQKILVLGAYRMAFLSNDGGKSWQDWSLQIYDKYSHNLYDAAFIGGAYYIVAEEGLVFGSTDGGATFKPLASPGGSTMLGILGAKDGSLIVFGVAGFAARSADGGRSWTPLTIATEQDLTGGRTLESGAMIIVDEAGLVFESIDNGMSFTSMKGIQPRPFFDVQQTSDGGLIAVGADGVTQIAQSLIAS